MRRLLLRLWRAWEWACIRSIEEWFDSFARAWQTGDGRPRREAGPYRTPAATLAPSEPAERPALASVPLLHRAAQPHASVDAIAGGLKKLGFSPREAKAAAEKACTYGGDSGEIMRRALAAARGDQS